MYGVSALSVCYLSFTFFLTNNKEIESKNMNETALFQLHNVYNDCYINDLEEVSLHSNPWSLDLGTSWRRT